MYFSLIPFFKMGHTFGNDLLSFFHHVRLWTHQCYFVITDLSCLFGWLIHHYMRDCEWLCFLQVIRSRLYLMGPPVRPYYSPCRSVSASRISDGMSANFCVLNCFPSKSLAHTDCWRPWEPHFTEFYLKNSIIFTEWYASDIAVCHVFSDYMYRTKYLVEL